MSVASLLYPLMRGHDHLLLPLDWPALMHRSPELRATLGSVFGDGTLIRPGDAQHPDKVGMPRAWSGIPDDVVMYLATALKSPLVVQIIDMLALTAAELAEPTIQEQVFLIEMQLIREGISTGDALARLRQEANVRDTGRALGAGAVNYSLGFGCGRVPAMLSSVVGAAAGVAGVSLAVLPMLCLPMSGALNACCAGPMVRESRLGPHYDPTPPEPPNPHDSYFRQVLHEGRRQYPNLSFSVLFASLDLISAYRLRSAINHGQLHMAAMQGFGCCAGLVAGAATRVGVEYIQGSINDERAHEAGRPHAPVAWLDRARKAEGGIDPAQITHTVASLQRPRAAACAGWLQDCGHGCIEHALCRIPRNLAECWADPAPAIGGACGAMVAGALATAANVVAATTSAPTAVTAQPTVPPSPSSLVLASPSPTVLGLQLASDVALTTCPGHIFRNVVTNGMRDHGVQGGYQPPVVGQPTSGMPLGNILTPAEQAAAWDVVRHTVTAH